MHGGMVTAASPGPGGGSEFVVRLPLDRRVPSSRGRVTERPRARRRVLVVEDHADAREMLCAALRLEGHEVFVAEDGPRGIEVALQRRPDVALIDIGLPGLSGYEVATRIRTALGRRATLVALTGYGQPEDRQRSHAAGFDAHVIKPVSVEDLNTVLDGDTDPGG
jgi:CheY-like chemotaxis protein